MKFIELIFLIAFSSSAFAQGGAAQNPSRPSAGQPAPKKRGSTFQVNGSGRTQSEAIINAKLDGSSQAQSGCISRQAKLIGGFKTSHTDFNHGGSCETGSDGVERCSAKWTTELWDAEGTYTCL